MTGLVAPGVDVGWSEAEPFGYAELEDSVLEMSLPVKPISCCVLGCHEGVALRKKLPFRLQ